MGEKLVPDRNHEMHIVLACDEVYAPQLATCLLSIVESNRSMWPLKAYVLTDSISDEIQRKVYKSLPAGSVSISWIPVTLAGFREFATAEHISAMTFARILMPSKVPESVSRVLYLDVDILVLGDLRPLWETDLGGCPLGAVLDGMESHLKNDTPGFEGVPRVTSYFNAGVLLIDLPRWRQLDISNRTLDYLRAYPKSPYSDQDALNVACDERWKQLASHWNYQDHINTKIEDLAENLKPRIVHFVTSLKPWNVKCLNRNASLYNSYRNRTEFRQTLTVRSVTFLKVSWYRSRRLLGRVRALRSLRNYLLVSFGRGEGIGCTRVK